MDKNIKKPQVTVLMPVYNGELYLRKAIDSILNQSFYDFEFLIINDGSVDKTEKIIKTYKDCRIKYISNPINKGISCTLNQGIKIARGEYIARMDCDDISLPMRLQKQIEFMKNHNDISACGTWIKTIGNKSGFINKYFTKPSDIKASLLFNTSLAHPSVMIRKSVIDENNLRYDKEHLHFEDYSLWVELSRCSKLANLPKILLLYRSHKSSICHSHTSAQAKGASFIRKKQLIALGLTPNEKDLYTHNSLYPKKEEKISNFIKKEEEWLMKILDTNKKNKIYNTDSLSKIIYIRWRTICGLNSNEGLRVWKNFIKSPLYGSYNKNKIWDSTKILIKSLLKK